jgi:hypothetical protein
VDPRRTGAVVTTLGAGSQAVGLGLDAYLHARDPNLAAKEGLFTLSNPGHLLLILGLGLVIIGAGILLLVPVVTRQGRRHRPAVAVLAAAAVLSVSGGTAWAASTTMGVAHTHAHAAATTASGVTSPTLPGAAPQTHAHGNGQVLADVPMDRATRDQLAAQLVEARQFTDSHRTIDMALVDGYSIITDYLPLIGAHLMKFSLVDGKFDIQHPEMLLYDGTGDGAKIVGLSYYVLGKPEPVGFAGANDHWHQHIGLCISTKQIKVIGAEGLTAAQCRARGGVKSSGLDAWMVHAWVVPGWESLQGVFSAENTALH